MSATTPSGPVTLVTGGAGFIGSHLVDALLARDERVICLDNFSAFYDPARKRANIVRQLENSHYTLIEGDICDRDLVTRIFTEYQPTRVAHLAALAGVRESVTRAELYTEVNLQGSIRLMDAARDHNVQNFVQASTSSIYGDSDQIPFREDQPTDRPLAPYPATKKACEVMGYAYHNMFGLNVTALRFFTVYGPRVRPDMMAYSVMDAIMKDREITLFDPHTMRRDWTFVDDIIQGVVAALDRPLGYEVINIGRGEPVLLQEFVDIIQELTGAQARVNLKPAPPSEPPVTYANVDRARELLGYNPLTSIRQGLEKTWEWYQSLEHTSSPG